ncbi:holo-ACP synthase [Marisediminicola senii]|uniref:holo-ACP synthase n=1 Tax=Marisediminicola senii TaxID=2711233 RepID=UPI0013EACF8F|nr:holo-ACP synthase [Marisediminicola senii]
MIVGIGVDVVDLVRFERAASRTPRLLPRLFSAGELETPQRTLSLRSLAGRFAAKEAFIKAIGHSDGVQWHDMRVVSDDHGNPSFELHGAAAAIASQRGIGSIHLTMSHDAGIAIAWVVAES